MLSAFCKQSVFCARAADPTTTGVREEPAAPAKPTILGTSFVAPPEPHEAKEKTGRKTFPILIAQPSVRLVTLIRSPMLILLIASWHPKLLI